MGAIAGLDMGIDRGRGSNDFYIHVARLMQHGIQRFVQALPTSTH
jgi:hypothetical protein